MDEAVRYVALLEAWRHPHLDESSRCRAHTVGQVPSEKSATGKSDGHQDVVPGPLLVSAAPVAVALSCSAPSFSSRLPASVQFFWDPRQPQHGLVHAVFLLPDAVAALVALLLLAEQPFCVLSHVSAQVSFVPLSHPT